MVEAWQFCPSSPLFSFFLCLFLIPDSFQRLQKNWISETLALAVESHSTFLYEERQMWHPCYAIHTRHSSGGRERVETSTLQIQTSEQIRAVWPRASDLTSLSLSVLMHKVGIRLYSHCCALPLPPCRLLSVPSWSSFCHMPILHTQTVYADTPH